MNSVNNDGVPIVVVKKRKKKGATFSAFYNFFFEL